MAMSMFSPPDDVVATVDDLRSLYRPPSKLVQGKKLSSIDDLSADTSTASVRPA